MSERRITDATGTNWTVIDVGQSANRQHHRIPPARSSGWLSFTRDDGFRVRVDREQAGPNWRRLGVSDLKRLLAEALRMSPRTGEANNSVSGTP